MRTFARTSLAVLALTLPFGIAASGHADQSHHHHHYPHMAPEIDPAMGTSALALLGGAIMVLRGRHKA